MSSYREQCCLTPVMFVNIVEEYINFTTDYSYHTELSEIHCQFVSKFLLTSLGAVLLQHGIKKSEYKPFPRAHFTA